MPQLNGGSATLTLQLEVNTALVEFYAHTILNQSGLDIAHFTTEQIVNAAERALQARFGGLAVDSDHFLQRFTNDERFTQELGV